MQEKKDGRRQPSTGLLHLNGFESCAAKKDTTRIGWVGCGLCLTAGDNRTRFAFSPMAKIKVALRRAVARNSPPDSCI